MAFYGKCGIILLYGKNYQYQEDNCMKKVLFIASECVPFIKTGGLADVVGSLPKCFDKKYFDVRVVLPKYMCMKEEYKSRLELSLIHI